MRHQAIFALYKNVAVIDDSSGIYDVNGDTVEVDELLVEEKMAELEIAKLNKVDARQSALNKLMALGLTEEEALALGK